MMSKFGDLDVKEIYGIGYKDTDIFPYEKDDKTIIAVIESAIGLKFDPDLHEDD